MQREIAPEETHYKIIEHTEDFIVKVPSAVYPSLDTILFAKEVVKKFWKQECDEEILAKKLDFCIWGEQCQTVSLSIIIEEIWYDFDIEYLKL